MSQPEFYCPHPQTRSIVVVNVRIVDVSVAIIVHVGVRNIVVPVNFCFLG